MWDGWRSVAFPRARLCQVPNRATVITTKPHSNGIVDAAAAATFTARARGGRRSAWGQVGLRAGAISHPIGSRVMSDARVCECESNNGPSGWQDLTPLGVALES